VALAGAEEAVGVDAMRGEQFDGLALGVVALALGRAVTMAP
jgi:hypothetical protein